MPKVSAAHMETRRLQILEAAIECFAAKGFHKTNMKEICRAANLSPGAIYTYFSGKQAIIAAIVEKAKGQNAAAFEKSRAPEIATPVERVLKDFFFNPLNSPQLQKKGMINIDSISEAVRDPELRPIMRQSWQEVVGQLKETAGEGQKREEIAADLDPQEVAWLLCSTWFGLLAYRLLFPDLDTDALGQTFIRMLHNMPPKED